LVNATSAFEGGAIVDSAQKRDVGTSSIGWWTAFFAFGSIHRVDVPACKPCAGRLWRTRLFRFVVTILCICVGIGVADHFTDGMRFRKVIVFASALVAMIPWIAWQAFVPAAIDITAYENKVDYDFRDPDYAEEFATLNGGTIE
jgi:hypothetical protein